MEKFIVPIKPMERMEFTSGKPTERPEGSSFESILEQARESLAQTTETADADSWRLAFGDVDDLAQLQINSMKAESMIQTTVQLTTRAVNAYKEIMQMQI